jgi:integrase
MAHFPKPFFKKARGVWYVEIKRKQINLGPDRDEAFRTYHAMMAQPQRQSAASGSLAAIFDAFLEWVQINRAPDTYEWYRYRLQRFLDHHPDLLADELRPYHVENWACSYGLSRTSRRNYLRSVKRCLKWAKKQGYIDRNPIEDLEVPSADAKEVYVAPDEFQVMLGFTRNQSLEDICVVTYETGCRPQESLIVTADNVDLPNQRWVFTKSESKGKRIVRAVYLSETALAITNRRMLTYPSGPLFRNTRGGVWSADAVNCCFDALRQRMGRARMAETGEEIPNDAIEHLIPSLVSTKTVKGTIRDKTAAELRAEAKRKLINRRVIELVSRYSLYALRHSWATNALQKGVDALTVAILMGHEDPSTLSKVYQHLTLNPAHMLEQARKAAG